MKGIISAAVALGTGAIFGCLTYKAVTKNLKDEDLEIDVDDINEEEILPDIDME